MTYEVNSSGRVDPVPGTEPDDESVTAAEILAGLANSATGLADIETLGRDAEQSGPER